MIKIQKKPHRQTRKITTGFSLAEVMLSVVIISIITVGLSMALFRTREKVHTYSADLTSNQNHQTVLRQIAQDCRQAVEIHRVSDGKYMITLATNPLETVTYHLKPNYSLVKMYNSNPDCKILLTEVGQFFFETETDIRNETAYLRSMTIVLKLGLDNKSETYTHTVSLLNSPLWEDAMS